MSEKGLTIFRDVFRRADKNDDGKLSWEEFAAAFADGVQGKEELQSLFNEIDTHNTNNIDVGELCEYFSSHLGQFQEVYALMEELNSKISSVLSSTAKTYSNATRTEKFVNRFLLQEAITQTSALQVPLEMAWEHLHAEAKREREDIEPFDPIELKKTSTDTPDVVPGRHARRAKRQASNISTSSHTDTYGAQNPAALAQQVDRLTSLLDRLEHSVNFGSFVDEDLNAVESDKMALVQREFRVKDDLKDSFRQKLRDHIEKMQKVTGCLSISVCFYKDSGSYSVYEVWASDADLGRCNSEEKFMQEFSSFVTMTEPEQVVNFPGSWWKRE